MIHDLKCRPPWFEDVVEGRKTFELRINDRDFHVGDFLLLREFTREGYTGNQCVVEVVYLLVGTNHLRSTCAALGIRVHDVDLRGPYATRDQDPD